MKVIFLSSIYVINIRISFEIIFFVNHKEEEEEEEEEEAIVYTGLELNF